jgi:hypothetical protein
MHFKSIADNAINLNNNSNSNNNKKKKLNLINDKESNDIKEILSVVDNCFHSGYSENILSNNNIDYIQIVGPSVPNSNQFNKCRESLLLTLFSNRKDRYCQDAYNGQCSINGEYQPSLPRAQTFIGTYK